MPPLTPAPAPAPPRCGAVAFRPLPGGRPFPRPLVARQFGARQVALVDDRIDGLCGGPAPGGVPLSAAERADLADLLRAALLPELYDPEYEDPPMPGPAPPATPAEYADRLRAESDRIAAELEAVGWFDRWLSEGRAKAREHPGLAALYGLADPPPAGPPTAFDRVDAFLRGAGPAPLADIAAGTGLSKSAVKGILYTSHKGRFRRAEGADGVTLWSPA